MSTGKKPKPKGKLTAEGLAYMEAVSEEELETLRTAYSNTGNPIYVWKAIHAVRFVTIVRADWNNHPTPWDPLSNPVQLPPWCTAYLSEAAKAVDELSWGIDSRRPPGQPVPADFYARDFELSERQRLEVLPAVFGFSRQGWNAFAEYQAIKSIGFDVQAALGTLREEGVSAREAMDEMMERTGFTDERSVRRLFAKHRRTYSDPQANESSDPKDET